VTLTILSVFHLHILRSWILPLSVFCSASWFPSFSEDSDTQTSRSAFEWSTKCNQDRLWVCQKGSSKIIFLSSLPHQTPLAQGSNAHPWLWHTLLYSAAYPWRSLWNICSGSWVDHQHRNFLTQLHPSTREVRLAEGGSWESSPWAGREGTFVQRSSICILALVLMWEW
jgi:hypothetical protein